MNKVGYLLDDLDSKIDRVRQKLKTSKIICQNNTDCKPQMVFSHNVYGSNKVLGYDITVLGNKPVNIVIKLDDVVVTAVSGVVAVGEIMLKSNKLYSFAVECTGEEMLAAKLKLKSVDLRVI